MFFKQNSIRIKLITIILFKLTLLKLRSINNILKEVEFYKNLFMLLLYIKCE